MYNLVTECLFFIGNFFLFNVLGTGDVYMHQWYASGSADELLFVWHQAIT